MLKRKVTFTYLHEGFAFFLNDFASDFRKNVKTSIFLFNPNATSSTESINKTLSLILEMKKSPG